MKQQLEMSIKAKVNAPVHSSSDASKKARHGKEIEIIDFVTTPQGLVAITLIEENDGVHILPLFIWEIFIEKSKGGNYDQ